MEDRVANSREVYIETHQYKYPFKDDYRKRLQLLKTAIEIYPQNVMAIGDLAMLYLGSFNDPEEAEAYCRMGFEVKQFSKYIIEFPSTIGDCDILEWKDDMFNSIMMRIRFYQGRHGEAQEYLQKMKRFHDRSGKGLYPFASTLQDWAMKARTGD